jgi:hypothetical protein
MVLAKMGFAFMPEYSVTANSMLGRPLIEPEVRRTVMIVSMRGRPYSPAGKAFVRAVHANTWSNWYFPGMRDDSLRHIDTGPWRTWARQAINWLRPHLINT